MNWQQVYWLAIAVIALLMTFAVKAADPRCCYVTPLRDADNIIIFISINR